MKNLKKLIKAISFPVILLFNWTNVIGQSFGEIPEPVLPDSISTNIEPVEMPELITEEPVDSISELEIESGFIELSVPRYEEWETVMIQGKLKMKGLPLSPSLRIYMERDSLIDISLRAPFIGEAGKLIITPDTVTAINKMNKTYMKEGIGEFSQYYPGGIGDIQDIFLGRVFIPGFDIEEELDNIAEIFHEDGQLNLIPKEKAQIEGIKYGYVIDEDFRPLMLVIIPERKNETEIDVIYTYEPKGYDIEFVLQNGEEYRNAFMELKDPEWEAKSPKGIDLEKKYRRMSLGDFMRNIMK